MTFVNFYFKNIEHFCIRQNSCHITILYAIMRKSLSTILIAAAMAAVVSCQKEEKETPAAKPVVNIEECRTVKAEGETITLKVTITDPVENGAGQTKVTPDCDWIDSPVFTETALTFDVLKYETDEENPENRTAVITVEYPDAETVKVEVTQSAPAIEDPDDPETPETPVVNVTWDSTTVVPVEGGTYTAAYSIEHPAEDAALKAVPEQDWITVTGTQDGIIAFTVAGNGSEPGSGPRHGTISLSYPGADDITPITFIQEAEEEVVEEGLTFTIDITSVSSDGVYFNITVSDEEATYYRAVMEKTEFDAFGSDMALIEENIEYFLSEDWLGNPGSIEDYIYTGSEQDCYEYLYNADTDYYIYAYGLNTDGTVTSNGITKVPFHSAARPELTVEWDNNTVIPMEGGSYEVPFVLKNPIEGQELSASAGYNCSDWVTDVSVDSENCVIRFTVLSSSDVTPGYEENRSGFVNLYYYNLASTPTILFKQELPTY